MSKRFFFIIASLLAGLGLFFVAGLNLNSRIIGTAILSFIVAVGIFSLFRLLTGKMRPVSLTGVLTLPFALTLAFGLIFFHFPNFSLFFRICLMLAFVISIYFSLLAANILRVVAEKKEKIPLLRVAQAAAYVLATVSLFFLFTAIYKANIFFFIQSLLVFLTTFALALPFLELHEHSFSSFLANRYKIAFLLAVMVGAASLAASFFPLKSFLRALFLAGFYYVLLGLYQNYVGKSLTRRVWLEYAGVGLLILAVMFFLM